MLSTYALGGDKVLYKKIHRFVLRSVTNKHTTKWYCNVLCNMQLALSRIVKVAHSLLALHSLAIGADRSLLGSGCHTMLRTVIKRTASLTGCHAMLHSNNWSYPPSNIRDITIRNHAKLSIVMHNYMPSITPPPPPTPVMPPCAARTWSEDPSPCAPQN